MEATQVMNAAAVEAGAPDGLVSCLEPVTMEATDALIHHKRVAAILATGGTAMLRAAYSSGKPAFGGEPGSVPAFIERTANVRQAVADILTSKTFDNGTVFASEQAIVTESAIEEQVIGELEGQGASGTVHRCWAGVSSVCRETLPGVGVLRGEEPGRGV